jgi:hypothetical protein
MQPIYQNVFGVSKIGAKIGAQASLLASLDKFNPNVTNGFQVETTLRQARMLALQSLCVKQ